MRYYISNRCTILFASFLTPSSVPDVDMSACVASRSTSGACGEAPEVAWPDLKAMTRKALAAMQPLGCILDEIDNRFKSRRTRSRPSKDSIVEDADVRTVSRHRSTPSIISLLTCGPSSRIFKTTSSKRLRSSPDLASIGCCCA